jgi:hypothetical protein
VRIVLVVRVVRPLLLGIVMMADGAAGRRAEQGMVAGYVSDDRSGRRACHASGLRACRGPESEAERGNDPNYFHGCSILE